MNPNQSNDSNGKSTLENSALAQANSKLQELTEHADSLALVAKYTDNAVIITDAAGFVEWANDGFERISGYKLEEVKGKKPGSFLQGEETNPETIKEMRECIKNRKGFNVEIVNYTKQGEKYWLGIDVRPIYDNAGELVKFIAIERDITARKEVEAEKELLSQQFQAAARIAGMSEVATGVLHNVGNNLNSVCVTVNTLHKLTRNFAKTSERIDKAAELIRSMQSQETSPADFNGNDQRGRQLCLYFESMSESIRKLDTEISAELEHLTINTEHMKQIVMSQNSLSQSLGGIMQEIDLSKLIFDCVGNCQLHKDAVPELFSVSIVPKQIEVEADQHKIIQILDNLLVNAIEAIAESATAKPEVRVLARLDDDAVTIQVIDNVIGIEPDRIDRIFQFGETSKKTGHGFGLHHSANLAREMGGSLCVCSEGLGQGCKFELRLPIESSDQPVNENSSSQISSPQELALNSF